MPYIYTPSPPSASTVQDPSSHHASTTAQQGSTGAGAPPRGQHPRRDECDEKKEHRVKQDLLGIGFQFETKK
ncbi:hypothetical protein FJTKL_14912 [Diaporthe vaccinii]|uniref:Uncharacterized protein n=1 Tax=Diaporthe vaccinii TaxID=105482 RepID=A0ABR4E6L9_9PEZI